MPAAEPSAPPPAAGSFYVTGGTLPSDAASYVPRQADHDLLDGLTQGEFCYVLNTRQMGKSSLMIRTAHHLRQQGDTVAVLDLTAVGQNLTPEQWYDGLLMSLAEQLHLEDDLEDFWDDNPGLGPLQRFITAIGRVVLPTIPQRLILFVDEIDAVRSLPFPADEFFAAIRECYNRRRLDPLYEKLAFCLLGVATPADLIQDTRLSPFNIGQRILLTDFTASEAAPLARGLGGGAVVLDRVLHWTNGHPYMTQRLCRAIAEEPETITPAQVDALCERLFLTKQARDTDDNLAFVRNRLLRSEVDLAALLDLYQQVRAGKKVKDDETNPLVPVLRLSGVVNAPNGVLALRNRVYDRVFDKDWVRAHMPDAELRRQQEAYRRGALRAAALASVVLVLMGLLSAWALSASHAAQASARTATKALTETRAALTAEKAAEGQAKDAERRANEKAEEASLARQAAEQAAARETAANHLAQRDEATAKGALAETQHQKAAATEQARLARTNEQEAVSQRGRATVAARQATTEAKVARDKAREALQQKSLAEHAQRIGDLQLAGQTWESEDGSAQSVQDLLNQSAGSGGSGDARPGTERFEWRLLWEKLNRGSATTTSIARSFYRHIAVTAAGDILGIDEQERLCDTPASEGAETTRRPLPDSAALNSISCAFLSRDGTQVAVGRQDGHLDLYATDTLRRIQSWKIGGAAVSGGSFDSSGGTIMASAGSEMVRERVGADLPLSHLSMRDGSRGVSSSGGANISPTGRYLIWMNTPSNGLITLRDLTRKDGANFLTHVLSGHNSSVRSVKASPDESLLASGDDDGRVCLWDTASGSLIKSWVAQPGQIYALGFSSDSKRLAVGGANGLIRLWDVGRGGAALSGMPRPMITLKSHTKPISSLNFSPNDQWLASADDGGTVRAWPLDDTTRAPQGIDQDDAVETLAFAPDSRTFVCTYYGHPGIRAYDRNGVSSKLFRLPPGLLGGSAPVQSVAFSPDGRTAAAGWVEAGASSATLPVAPRCFLQFWDWRTGRAGARWESPPGEGSAGYGPMYGGLRRLAFSPDGRTVAGGFGENYWGAGNYDQVVKLWDASTGRETRTLTGFRNNINAVCFSADGRMLVVGCVDATVRCFDTRTWAESHHLSLGNISGLGAASVACSPDGHTLAIGSEDGLIHLTDTIGWQLRTLAGRSAKVADLAFSPDGRTLASASWDHTLKLWDVATGRKTYTAREDGWVHRVAFSPDGTRLAYGGKFSPVRVLQAAADEQVAAWQRQQGAEQVQPLALHWTTMAAEQAAAAALLSEVARRQVPGYAQADPKANLLRPRFGQTHWRFYNAQGGQASLMVGEDDTFTDHVTATGNVEVTQNQLPLKTGGHYLLQFRARADKNRVIGVVTQRDVGPWEVNGLSKTIEVSDQWRAFRIPFTMRETPPGNGELIFGVGQATGMVEVADAILVPEQAPAGEGGTPGRPQGRTAGLLGKISGGLRPWTDPIEQQRQARLLLDQIEKRQTPDDHTAEPAADLILPPSAGPRFSLMQDSSLGSDAATTDTSSEGVMTVHVRRTDGRDWHIVLERTGLPLVKGDRYILQFRAKASMPQRIHLLSLADDRYPNEATEVLSGLDEFLWLRSGWQAYRLTLQVGVDTVPGHGALHIEVGQQANTLQFADMVLISEKDAARAPGSPGEIKRRSAPTQSAVDSPPPDPASGVLQRAAAAALLSEVARRQVPGYAQVNPAANLLRPRYGHSHWRYWLADDAGARAVLTVGDDDSFTDHILAVTPNNWQVQVTQNQLPLETGRRYVLQFRARADKERVIGVMTQRDVSPWEPNGLSETLDVTTKWRAFRLSFTMNEVPPGNAELVFLLGQDTGTIQVADAVLVPENAPPGQGISPSSAQLRTAAMARLSLSGAHRWTTPAEERRQAQALLGEIERHQVPGQDLSLPLPDLHPTSSGGPPLSLRLDPGLSADAAAAEASPDGITTAHVRQVDRYEWHVVLERTGLPLVKGRRYLIQFRARANAPQTIHALSQVDVHAAGAAAQNQSGLLNAAQYHSGLDEFLRLTPQWQAFRLSLQPGQDAPEGTSSLEIEIGQQVNTLQFADMIFVSEKTTSPDAAANSGPRKTP